MAKIIKLITASFKNRKIVSAGNCPLCGNLVEYQGTKPIYDGEIKGLGFKGHKGICIKCKSEFSITPE